MRMDSRYLHHKISKLKHCAKGVTAIEFAIIAPVALMILMGTVEISLMMYAIVILEGATFQGSRTGKTGYVEGALTQEQTIIARVEDYAGILLDINALQITSKSYSNFGNIEQGEPFVDLDGDGVRDSGENFTDTNGNGVYDDDLYDTAGYGGARDITVYTVSYPWQVFTPMLAPFFNNGTMTLSARTVVKNEPY